MMSSALVANIEELARYVITGAQLWGNEAEEEAAWDLRSCIYYTDDEDEQAKRGAIVATGLELARKYAQIELSHPYEEVREWAQYTLDRCDWIEAQWVKERAS